MAMTEEQIEELRERAEEVALDHAREIVEAAKSGKAVSAEDYAFLLAWMQYRVDYEEYDDEYDEDDEDYDEDEDDD